MKYEELKELLKINNKDPKIVDYINVLDKFERRNMLEAFKWIDEQFDCEPNGAVISDIMKYISEYDNIELGDLVHTAGGFKSMFGKFGLEGRVCCIEDDVIWFLSGNCPEKYIMSGKLKHDSKHVGSKFSWTIMNRHRSALEKGSLSYCNTEPTKRD